MKNKIIESKILGEKCVTKVLDNGLTVLVCEKNDFSSAYAIFGTRFGSIDSAFLLDGEKITLPDGIAHFLEHKMFENEDGDAFKYYHTIYDRWENAIFSNYAPTFKLTVDFIERYQ